MNTISLSIVEIQHTKIYKIGTGLWIISILLLIYTLYFKINNELLRLVISIISLIFVIIIPIFIGIRRTLIKEYKEIGLFFINQDYLTIMFPDKNIEYKFSNLNNIKIDFNAVAGRQFIRAVGLTEGINNFFHFDFNNEHFQYRLLIKNITYLRFLDNILHDSGLNIEILRYGKKVNRLIDIK
jgi:hypothetical protein